MIEIPTFQQILEMDDDEDERDFSKSIVYDFFDQAENTFEQMTDAVYVHVSTRLPAIATESLILWVIIC